jgi:hypothetical protein
VLGKFGSAALIAVIAGGGGTENRSPEGGFDDGSGRAADH